MDIHENAPPGWSGSVTAMKKRHGKEIGNPYALAWDMKNKGDKPHCEKTDDDKTSRRNVPEKKKKYRESFSEWMERRAQSAK